MSTGAIRGEYEFFEKPKTDPLGFFEKPPLLYCSLVLHAGRMSFFENLKSTSRPRRRLGFLRKPLGVFSKTSVCAMFTGATRGEYEFSRKPKTDPLSFFEKPSFCAVARRYARGE